MSAKIPCNAKNILVGERKSVFILLIDITGIFVPKSEIYVDIFFNSGSSCPLIGSCIKKTKDGPKILKQAIDKKAICQLYWPKIPPNKIAIPEPAMLVTETPAKTVLRSSTLIRSPDIE